MSQFLNEAEVHALNLASVGSPVLLHRHLNIVFPENLSLGSHSRIDGFSVIVAQAAVSIGSYVHIGSFCNISGAGGVRIGNFSTLSQGVKLYSVSDDYSGTGMTNPMVPAQFKDVHVERIDIGEHVVVGSGTVVLPGSVLPEGVAIGALSLVKGVLEPWGVYGGVPARRLKDRSRELLVRGATLIEQSKST